MDKKIYLVTGGAGFIGGAVSKKLIEYGHGVVTIDNLSTGYRENLPDDVEFIEGDCSDVGIINRLKRYKFDAIFHIAGQSSGEISFSNPEYDLNTNALSTLLLLKYAVENGCKRFIFAGTMSVYGNQPEAPTNEKIEGRPVSFYAVSKIASEHFMRLFSSYGIKSTSLRLFNVYGPGQNLNNLRQGMVSIYLAQMIRNNHILVKGSGKRFRDFVYIDDVVDAFITCLSEPGTIGLNINIGTGIKTTVNGLIEKMKELYEDEVVVEYDGNTPGDIHGIYADISLAGKVLSYAPKINLEKGLKRMMKWAMNA